MHRLIRLVLILCLLAAFRVPSSAAQTDDSTAAASMAHHLSVLEANGDFNALYDLIHPDAHAVVPRSAVIGWYQNEFAPIGVSPAEITGVRFVQWTWPVTGVTYAYTAEVSFVQPTADGGAIVDVVRLVQDQAGTWRWFFGRSAEFVAEQIRLYAQPTRQQTQFDSLHEFVINDLDDFWAASFSAGRERYRSPSVISFDEPGYSDCGQYDLTIGPAFYCGLNETIYVNLDYFDYVEYHIGDYAWITIMAHEWGHHVQFLDAVVPQSAVALELQADCLAGAYTRDAETRGLLSYGDVFEAIAISAGSGDPVGLPEDAGSGHGTGENRVSAFMRGYLDGFTGCDLDLTDGSGDMRPLSPTAPTSSAHDVLPRGHEIPSDLVQTVGRERALAEVAGNYIDPAGTERLFRSWGWRGNAIAMFEGNGSRSGVTTVYVSVHQLDSRRHAGEALTFSFEDQAASTGAWEIDANSSAQETRALRTASDVTLYAREGDYLIRLTVTSTLRDPVPVAVDILEDMLSRAN